MASTPLLPLPRGSSRDLTIAPERLLENAQKASEELHTFEHVIFHWLEGSTESPKTSKDLPSKDSEAAKEFFMEQLNKLFESDDMKKVEEIWKKDNPDSTRYRIYAVQHAANTLIAGPHRRESVKVPYFETPEQEHDILKDIGQRLSKASHSGGVQYIESDPRLLVLLYILLLNGASLKDSILDALEPEVARRACVDVLKTARKARGNLEKEAYDQILDKTVKGSDLLEAKLMLDLKEDPRFEAYYLSLKIRALYLLLLMSALLFGLFSGFLMKVFYGVFVITRAHPDAELTKCDVLFTLLPLATMLFALLADKISQLVLDVYRDPLFAGWQSRLLAVCHKNGDWKAMTKLPAGLYRFFDYFVLGSCEVGPLVSGLHNMYKFYGVRKSSASFLRGYLWGGIFVAFWASMLFLVSDIVIRVLAINGKESRATQRNIEEALMHFRVPPGSLHRMRKCVEVHAKTHGGGLIDRERRRVKKHKPLVQWRLWGCVVLPICIWLGVSGNMFTNLLPDVPYRIIGLIWGAVMVALSYAVLKRLKRITTGVFIGVQMIFVIIAGALMSANSTTLLTEQIMPIMSTREHSRGWDEHEQAAESPSLFHWVGSSHDTTRFGHHFRHQKHYGVCQQTFGSPQADLTALELGALSWIMYEPACENFAHLLHETFPENYEARTTYCTNYTHFPSRFAEFYFPPRHGSGRGGTRVIGVKGTSTVADAMLDTALYATVQVLQVFEMVVPVLSMLPEDQVQWLIQRTNFDSRDESQVWEEIQSYVNQSQHDHPDDFFIFTGHSLGGGIAQIVASRMSLPAVVWSAPGMVYSAKRFGADIQNAMRNIWVVMPQNDVVPQVDLQAGSIQKIECRAWDGSQGAAIVCHSLKKSCCEVWRVCGDTLDRNFNETCSPFFQEAQIGVPYPSPDL